MDLYRAAFEAFVDHLEELEKVATRAGAKDTASVIGSLAFEGRANLAIADRVRHTTEHCPTCGRHYSNGGACPDAWHDAIIAATDARWERAKAAG